MSHSQVDLGSLPVGCRVEADAVHLQFAGDLQDLVIGLGWSLAPGADDVTNTLTLATDTLYA